MGYNSRLKGLNYSLITSKYQLKHVSCLYILDSASFNSCNERSHGNIDLQVAATRDETEYLSLCLIILSFVLCWWIWVEFPPATSFYLWVATTRDETEHHSLCVIILSFVLCWWIWMVYFNTILNTTIYNYLTGVYSKSWQHVSVVHSTIIRP